LVINCLPLGLKKDTRISVPSDFVEKISAMDKQSLDFVVRRVMKDNKVSKEAALKSRTTFLRWASLKFVSNESLVPNLVADMFWHAFLMFTMDYHSWCEQHFGDFFHHVPEDEQSFEEIEQGLNDNSKQEAACCTKCKSKAEAACNGECTGNCKAPADAAACNGHCSGKCKTNDISQIYNDEIEEPKKRMDCCI